MAQTSLLQSMDNALAQHLRVVNLISFLAAILGLVLMVWSLAGLPAEILRGFFLR